MSEIIKLYPMQWRFVQEYIKDLNATQSAIRAGYARGSAKVTGSRLLSKANVQAALAQEQRRAAERAHVDQDRVLREYIRIAFADIRQIVQWDDTTVTLRKSSEVPPALGHAIAEVQQTANGVRVKLHSKLQALDALAKHLGLFREEEDDVGRTLSHAERVVRINQLLSRAGYDGTYDPDGAGASIQGQSKPH